MTVRKASKEDIYQACENFLQEGVDISGITVLMVYNKLGRKGSLGTVTPCVKKWKDEKLSQALSIIQPPQEVETISNDMIKKIWKVALDKAYKDAEGKLDDYSNLLAEKADIETIVSHKEEEIETLNDEIELLNVHIKDNQMRFVGIIIALRDEFNSNLGKVESSLESKDLEKIATSFQSMQDSMKALFNKSFTDQQQMLSDHINKATVGNPEATQSAEIVDGTESVDDAERSKQADNVANFADEV